MRVHCGYLVGADDDVGFEDLSEPGGREFDRVVAEVYGVEAVNPFTVCDGRPADGRGCVGERDISPGDHGAGRIGYCAADRAATRLGKGCN